MHFGALGHLGPHLFCDAAPSSTTLIGEIEDVGEQGPEPGSLIDFTSPPRQVAKFQGFIPDCGSGGLRSIREGGTIAGGPVAPLSRPLQRSALLGRPRDVHGL